MFFSEEKNQKTFASGAGARYGTWPARVKLREHKSLLLLFFRKEGLPCFLLMQAGDLCWSAPLTQPSPP
jgi:hypothetical protein